MALRQCLPAAAVLVLLAGCGAQTQDLPTADGSAVVDPVSGTIELPLDRYGMTDTERRTLEYAFDVVVSECMAARGFEYAVIDRREIQVKSDWRYGVWVESEVAKYGYGFPTDPATAELEKLNSAEYPPGWHDANTECGHEGASVVIAEPLTTEQQAFNYYDVVMASDQAEDVVREWKDCLDDQGVTPPNDGWMPPEAEDAPTEQQIAIALVDVRCKDDVDLVERLADLEADAQQATLDEREAEFAEQRAAIDEALQAAQQLSSAGG